MLQELATCEGSPSLDKVNRGYKLEDGILSICGMKFYFQLGVLCCVIALSIGAFAGSVTTLDDSAVVSSMPSILAQGTPNYELATGSFTGDSGFVPSLNVALNLDSGSDSFARGFAQSVSSLTGHQPVPEGGTQLSYLAGSGLVLFAGMLLAGKQRRRPTAN